MVAHKYDRDTFPSNPHAHNYDRKLKMHLGTGDLYAGKTACLASESRRPIS